MGTRQAHWGTVYSTGAVDTVNWYEASPAASLAAIESAVVARDTPIIDVGGGASLLVDELLRRGFTDLTVLDVSHEALDKVRSRLAGASAQVQFVVADVTAFQPTRHYGVWHDRAVFHFLVDAEDRRLYVGALRRALHPRGVVIIATFGPQGPERCSGLPIVRYAATTLAAELGDGFRLSSSFIDVHRTPSGGEQQFLHARFEFNAGG